MKTILKLSGVATVTALFVIPVGMLNPWLRDQVVTPADVIWIAALGLLLLFVHSRVFFELAALRDTRNIG